MRITGTFLDEITHDIPSANWGPEEWARDFDSMAEDGIDTVILIRAGCRDRMVFDSRALQAHRPMRPAHVDLIDLFLDQASRRGMAFYLGLYDGRAWQAGQCEREVQINMDLIDEVSERYADRPGFAGWYITHEISEYDGEQMDLYERLAGHCRRRRNLPILMSPYVRGSLLVDQPTTPEAHEEHWDKVFARLRDLVDIVAFQDGQVPIDELATYLEINARLARRHGLTSWSNVESFERGMPIDFMPIDWRHLADKMDAAEIAGMEKLITFEYSHFMSPNSIWPSARNLHARYMDYIQGRAPSSGNGRE